MRSAYRRMGFDPIYPQLLRDVQAMQTETFWELLTDSRSRDQKTLKELVMPYIRQTIEEKGYQAAGYTLEELCEKLYDDTLGYSILTKPLNDPEVEGIHVNAWDNVRLQFTDGSSMQVDGFLSPEQAVDILRRILQESGQTIDDAIPVAEGSLGSNIRITVVKSPVVDPDVGISCYIRKLSKKVFSEGEYLAGDFATAKELKLLSTALRRGVSTLLVGKVNTGKTTLLSYLLSTLPQEQEIITVEGGAREMNLAGENRNVIHMLTRESKNPDQNITQEMLVEKTLRLNPDTIAVAEMRNTEAYAAEEASLSGHVVISTAHAGSPQQAHRRIASLCRKKYPTDYQTALEQACEAFPLVIYIHTLEDKKRRIMAISECAVEDGKISYRPLWRYEITSNEVDADGRPKIIGAHKQVGNPSTALIEKMKMYGISENEIKSLLMEGAEPECKYS